MRRSRVVDPPEGVLEWLRSWQSDMARAAPNAPRLGACCFSDRAGRSDAVREQGRLFLRLPAGDTPAPPEGETPRERVPQSNVRTYRRHLTPLPCGSAKAGDGRKTAGS